MGTAKIDEASLRNTVEAFYARVRKDEQLVNGGVKVVHWAEQNQAS